MNLEGKVALITGGAKGIGRGIAFKLSNEGANRVVADILIKEAQEVAEELVELGTNSIALRLDVTSKKEIEDLLALIIDKYRKIDILVACAGIEQKPCPVIEIADEEWDRVLNINLRGVLYCCQFVGREMIKQKYGKIITISSLNGKTGVPYTVAYNVSKFGIIGLTKTLANELAAYNIFVNSVCPGPTNTELLERVWERKALILGVSKEQVYKNAIRNIPLQRLATADDIGDLVVFLASERSKYITGEVNYRGSYECYGGII